MVKMFQNLSSSWKTVCGMNRLKNNMKLKKTVLFYVENKD